MESNMIRYVEIMGHSLMEITQLTILSAAPIGVFLSVLAGVIWLKDTRRITNFIMLALFLIFGAIIGLESASALPDFLMQNRLDERIAFSIAFVTAAIWCFSIIYQPTQKRWVDSIALFGIFISALAAVFMAIVLRHV